MVDKAIIDLFPNLELIANFGVGYDQIDAKYAATRGVVVTNTPEVLTEEVADLTIALTLATLRQIPQADRYVRAGSWLRSPFPLSATLRERKAGILGMGRIGLAIAKRLEGFGIDIAYHNRSRREDVAYPYFSSALALAGAVDLLIVVTPGGAGTKHLVNGEVLSALGKNGVLINVSRGSVVDQVALIEALKNGTIQNAGLDVFENEPNVPQSLIDIDKVVLLPHVGSASVETRGAMSQLVVDNIAAWEAGQLPLTPVPESPSPRGRA